MGLYDHARYHVKRFGLVFSIYLTTEKIYPKTRAIKVPSRQQLCRKGTFIAPSFTRLIILLENLFTNVSIISKCYVLLQLGTYLILYRYGITTSTFLCLRC